ncbi:MAG: hypothetical protein U0470_05795 [Anaerolineae bacterium]
MTLPSANAVAGGASRTEGGIALGLRGPLLITGTLDVNAAAALRVLGPDVNSGGTGMTVGSGRYERRWRGGPSSGLLERAGLGPPQRRRGAHRARSPRRVVGHADAGRFRHADADSDVAAHPVPDGDAARPADGRSVADVRRAA